MSTRNQPILPLSIDQMIVEKIYILNNQKVMLDSDLAQLYGVDTKALNQAVKRNINRFPADFMFSLTKSDERVLGSQIVTAKINLNSTKRRSVGQAFTEQGIAMLSSVLRSSRAVQVNIQIMRTFTRIRQLVATHVDLREKILALEEKYDGQFKMVFEAIHVIIAEMGESET